MSKSLIISRIAEELCHEQTRVQAIAAMAKGRDTEAIISYLSHLIKDELGEFAS